jgi:hypothetical protein
MINTTSDTGNQTQIATSVALNLLFELVPKLFFLRVRRLTVREG